MSGHASAASADLAAQNYLDSDNQRTLLHDSQPDHADIPSESYEVSVAEIHSERDDTPESSDSDDTVEPESSEQNQLQKWIEQAGVLDSIKEDADDLRRSWSDVSIVTVPMFLKRTKKEAYVPQTVSLGPYHYASDDVPSMGHHKARALRRMATRFNTNMNLDTDSDSNEVFVQHAMSTILKLGDKIRNSYEGNIRVVPRQYPHSCERENLAWMLCLDGCFILEVLKTLGRYPSESYGSNDEGNDPIFGENKVAASNILKDILMMENQIPLIVLLELQRLENPMDNHVEEKLLELVVKGTSGLFKISGEKMERHWLYSVEEVHHILGFLHKVIVGQPSEDGMPVDQGDYSIYIKRCIGHCLLKLQDRNKALNDEFESIPHAVELKNAGIKFLPCNVGISRIMFERRSATIYLPPLSITYGTEVLFRNLVAFEMCMPLEINYVSSYLNFMDDLIDSQNDVALLRSNGILTNRIGSDKEVADLFNGLCKDVGTENMENVFDEVKKEVNAHYKNKIRVQLAEFVRDHCSSPWKVFASLVAVFILCLALLQTIFTIKK